MSFTFVSANGGLVGDSICETDKQGKHQEYLMFIHIILYIFFNMHGGIQGGISNGMDVYFNVAFKPR